MADKAPIKETRVAMGLDKPLAQQFFIHVDAVRRGGLGMSLTSGRPVASDLANRLTASLELTLTALFLACTIAMPMGGLAGCARSSTPARGPEGAARA